MARVPYASGENVPELYKAAFDRIFDERGGANIFLALANIPNLTGALLDFTKEMKHGAAIAQPLREIAILTVGLVSDCDYEFDHHWNIALKAGLSRTKMEQIGNADTSPLFDAAERAIIRYAKEVTLTADASDETWAELRRRLPLREAMDIVMAVAWYNGVVRMLKPMRVDHEAGFLRD